MAKWLDDDLSAYFHARRAPSRRAVTAGIGAWAALGSAAAVLSGCAEEKISANVLRTPDERFVNLAGYNFAPHYMNVPSDIGPLRMHYVDEGDRRGDVILLLHGQANWAYSYRAMIPVLVAAGYRVIAPDLIGFGRSDKLKREEDYTYLTHVNWVRSFLQSMSLKNVTAFMFDWGGFFGLRVAAEAPELFDRLVLSNTQLPLADDPAGNAWYKKFRDRVLSAPEFPISKMVKDGTLNKLTPEVIAAYDAPYPDESFKTGPRHLPLILPLSPDDPPMAANRAAWKTLKTWQKPVLTLYSKQFTNTSLGPEPLLEHIPGTRGQPHALLKAGFYIIEDQPLELASHILHFAKTKT